MQRLPNYEDDREDSWTMAILLLFTIFAVAFIAFNVVAEMWRWSIK